ncbi:MAG: hypothetical protein ACYC69_02640 [Thermodesulfovibrionales bacterium]
MKEILKVPCGKARNAEDIMDGITELNTMGDGETDYVALCEVTENIPKYRLKKGNYIYVEKTDHMGEAYVHALDKQEKAEIDADAENGNEFGKAFLKDQAADVVKNLAEQADVHGAAFDEMWYAWGLEHPADNEVGEDYKGVVVIIESPNFADAEDNHPTFLRDDQDDVIGFASVGDAQEWIDEVESERYDLSHGEMGRPEYTIVPSEGRHEVMYEPEPEEEHER